MLSVSPEPVAFSGTTTKSPRLEQISPRLDKALDVFA